MSAGCVPCKLGPGWVHFNGGERKCLYCARGSASVDWVLTISEAPARTIVVAFEAAWNESLLGKDAAPVLRAIAHQHPKLAREYRHLFAAFIPVFDAAMLGLNT